VLARRKKAKPPFAAQTDKGMEVQNFSSGRASGQERKHHPSLLTIRERNGNW